jgi:hypothetical protein
MKTEAKKIQDNCKQNIFTKEGRQAGSSLIKGLKDERDICSLKRGQILLHSLSRQADDSSIFLD